MQLQSLVEQYGYGVVLLGTFLEGETVLVVAAAAAKLGMLRFPLVLAVASVGAFIGDTLYFFIGRRYGARLVERSKRLSAAMPRIDSMIARWRWGAVIALRFTYGLRTVGPMIIGTGSMPAWQFLVANAFGAVLWAAIVGAIGYAAGHATQQFLESAQRVEQALLALAIAVALLIALSRYLIRHRQARSVDPRNRA
jgi:membrane protein DedA with SNARE-associated domain